MFSDVMTMQEESASKSLIPAITDVVPIQEESRLESTKDAKVSTIVVYASNVDVAFADAFTLPRKRSEGNLKITYMNAAFETPNTSGIFFIVFETQVWKNDVIKQFELMGAHSVSTVKFKRQGACTSQANALDYVTIMAEKFKCGYSRGCIPRSLIRNVKDLMKNEANDELQTVRVDMLAYVYCISSPVFHGLVKIGRTTDLRHRLSNGNTFAAPAPFMQNSAVPTFNAKRDERHTHVFFKQYHKVGEFFEVSPQSVHEYFMSHIVPKYQQDLEKVEDKEKALKMSYLLLKSAELPKKQKTLRFNPAICESPCSKEQEWIYGMCSPAFPGKIKIGRTADLVTRLSNANVFCAPAPHVYVATVPTFNSVRDDAMIHEHFDEFRREGEFFEISVESLREYFSSRIFSRYKLTCTERRVPSVAMDQLDAANESLKRVMDDAKEREQKRVRA